MNKKEIKKQKELIRMKLLQVKISKGLNKRLTVYPN